MFEWLARGGEWLVAAGPMPVHCAMMMVMTWVMIDGGQWLSGCQRESLCAW